MHVGVALTAENLEVLRVVSAAVLDHLEDVVNVKPDRWTKGLEVCFMPKAFPAEVAPALRDFVDQLAVALAADSLQFIGLGDPEMSVHQAADLAVVAGVRPEIEWRLESTLGAGMGIAHRAPHSPCSKRAERAAAAAATAYPLRIRGKRQS
jgi:hypothetical protein